MLPYINEPFVYVANLLGASSDELKLIFVFLLSYPLAGVLKRLPDDKPWVKNVFNIAIALFYLVGLFDLWSGLVVLSVDALATYLIAAYVSGPYMPWIGFVFLMGHMSVSHIYRQMLDNPTSVDITGAQMVLVMKLSAFCWNVWDGRQKPSDLNADQLDRRLTQLPHPLDYAGFVAFFPSIMIGPAFDYVDYHRWLNTTMFDLPPGTDPAKAPPTRKKRRIPRSATPAMWKLATGLAWLVLFLQASKPFNPEVLLSPRYTRMNLFARIFYLQMVSFVARTKYYAVWTLTEGACILSGIGYKGIDPKTGTPDWSRLTNIRPLGVELAQNSHAYLGNWNINTNHWLRNYMYLRVTPKGQKPGFRASMATFVTSAFWHGFLPGYYMTFVLASFIQNVAKNSRRLLRPLFMTPDGSRPLPRKRAYDLLTWLLTQLVFSFTTAPFLLLTIPRSLQVWARLYFYCVVGVAAASLFLASPGKVWLQRQVRAHTASRPAARRAASTESLQGATLGVPGEPGQEWDELVEEVVQEVRKRRAGRPGPEGPELKRLVEGALQRSSSMEEEEAKAR